jgi:hypothetical protein
MPDLDELTNTHDMAALIRRVLTEDQIEVLFDEEGNPAVALLGFDRLMKIMEEADPQIRILREHIQTLVRKEQERVQALIAREPERLARRTLPWEAIKADPAWQQKWDALLADTRSRIPPDLTPEEIDAEIEAAREAVHQEQRARHG